MLLLELTSTDWLFIVICCSFTVVLCVAEWMRYRFYKKKKNARKTKTVGLVSGHEVAEQLLEHHDIKDVKIVMRDSVLIEYWFSPRKNELYMSPRSYYGSGMYDVMRAGHTAAHAVQRQKAYRFIDVYIFFEPFVAVMTRLMPLFLLVCLFVCYVNPRIAFVLFAILYAAPLLLTVLMQQFENDASRIATEWLVFTGAVAEDERAELAKAARFVRNYNLFNALFAGFALLLARRRPFIDNDYI